MAITSSIARRIRSGATTLLIGTIADGEFLKRDGASIVGAPGGGVGSSVDETELAFTDITTANSSTTKHGLLKKLSNVAGEVLDGQGAWRTIAAILGYTPAPLEISQNSQSAAYTTVLSDSGKHILHPATDDNARTFTIDSNANVAYPIGTAITFVNMINTLTIAITSDTMTLMGAGSTGSRTLAAGNIATAIKVDTASWVISGSSGLT